MKKKYVAFGNMESILMGAALAEMVELEPGLKSTERRITTAHLKVQNLKWVIGSGARRIVWWDVILMRFFILGGSLLFCGSFYLLVYLICLFVSFGEAVKCLKVTIWSCSTKKLRSSLSTEQLNVTCVHPSFLEKSSIVEICFGAQTWEPIWNLYSNYSLHL